MKRGRKMIKKIMKRIMRKNKTENNIAWPSSWDYESVMNFNAMLMGMSLEKIQP